MTADEQVEAVDAPKGAEAASEGATPKAKQKAAKGDRTPETHGERAIAGIRAAKRGQREVTDPGHRGEYLLAEANVLALLDLADAIRGGSAETE